MQLHLHLLGCIALPSKGLQTTVAQLRARSNEFFAITLHSDYSLPSCFRASISFLYSLGNHRAPLDFKIGYTKMRITILYATIHLTKSQSDGISKLPQISFILRREHGKVVGPLSLDT